MRRVDKKAFAARFKRRLEKIGITPTAMARALGVPQQTVDNVVQAKVERPRLIEEMAEILLTTSKWLLFEEGPEEIVAPFSPEEVLALAKGLTDEQRGIAVRFLKTLAEKSTKAA